MDHGGSKKFPIQNYQPIDRVAKKHIFPLKGFSVWLSFLSLAEVSPLEDNTYVAPAKPSEQHSLFVSYAIHRANSH